MQGQASLCGRLSEYGNAQIVSCVRAEGPGVGQNIMMDFWSISALFKGFLLSIYRLAPCISLVNTMGILFQLPHLLVGLLPTNMAMAKSNLQLHMNVSHCARDHKEWNFVRNNVVFWFQLPHLLVRVAPTTMATDKNNLQLHVKLRHCVSDHKKVKFCY